MTTAVIAILASCLALVAAPAQAALTEGPRLAAVYDTILQARFDRIDAQLTQTCPPAPEGACKALSAVSVWWQVLLDPEGRLLDGRLKDLSAAAILANEAWTLREPQRAEAWFYLAGSYAPLVQWRVLRGERLAAARDGKKIKDALERALELDPGLHDAYFGLGLYHYYADVAPAAVKILRWFLFLPGGDRVKGLREMLQARQQGELLKGEADYQIHLIYLWYEQKPAQAIGLLEALDARYPTNPLFLQRIAEVQDEYFHDRPASAASWLTLLERARGGRVNSARLAEVRARLGLAIQLDAMFESDRAIAYLKPLIGMNAVEPYGAAARAQLQLGIAYDRLGQRDLALAAYRLAAARAPRKDPQRIRERARAGMRKKPDAKICEAYRLSIEGWRALERGALAQAESSLARAVTLAPDDDVARYRYARALAALGDNLGARKELEQLLAPPIVPVFVLASAYVELAQLLERAGDRPRAISMYRHATQVVGGDPHARDQATRALKRLAPTSGAHNFF